MNSTIKTKESLKKLLYSDQTENASRAYLNINLLRDFKASILENMSPKERGCINLYHLENFLIELALDPATEEIYKDYTDLVKDTLRIIRSRPEYWLLNSEVYLEILESLNVILDSKVISKELTAVYNYLTQTEFKILERKRERIDTYAEDDVIREMPNYLGDTTLYSSEDYMRFLRIVESDSFVLLDPNSRTFFDSGINKVIYNFFKSKYSISKSDEIIVQNFILFFSYVEYNTEISPLWNCKVEKSSEVLIPSTKKYNLRLSKYNIEQLEEIFFEKQIKLVNLQEQINKLKDLPRVREFLSFHNNKCITPSENSKENSEVKLKMIINAYTLLHNILAIYERYHQFKRDVSLDHNDDKLSLLRKHFETYKKLRKTYTEILTTDDESDLVEFYIHLVEQRENFKGCLRIMERYQLNNSQVKIFGSNATLKDIEKISESYTNEYYNAEHVKRKRIYKIENAGLDWTEEDIRKFHEGLRMYGHLQLANTKIAKYMGSHIEISHVKLFRGKISKARRIKKKTEKETKINEMKKNKHVKWKQIKEEHLYAD